MTRAAVIGVGSMGKNHVRVYNEMPEVELVAVVDANPQTLEQVVRMYRVPAYANVDEMIERERPDVVSVVVPTSEHFEVALRALELGCHVLVEKPIAATVEQAYQLIEVAERGERVFTVGHIERYNPAVIELKRRLDIGELGAVFQIQTRRWGPLPTRIRDVGVTMDLAPHDLDIMRYLTGSEAIRVYALTKYKVSPSQDDLFIGIVDFENGAVGVLDVNWLTPTKIRELYVTGAGGMYRVNYLSQDLFHYENPDTKGSDWAAMQLMRGVSEGVVNRYVIQKREPLRLELEAFVGRVQGRDVRLVEGRDAAAALSLAMALADAAVTGQVKKLSQNERHRIQSR
jgi:predicted dehydrogenase